MPAFLAGIDLVVHDHQEQLRREARDRRVACEAGDCAADRTGRIRTLALPRWQPARGGNGS
jgi:hypothetical protein